MRSSNEFAERETTDDATAQSQADGGGGVSISRVLLLGAAVGLAAFAVKQLPDLRRYLRLRSM
jgi:hypothetical protein